MRHRRWKATPVHSPAPQRSCAGWSAGQLDQEIAENVWLSLPASAELVFNHDRDTLWEQGFASLGIDPGFFAGDAGSA